ncbi:acyl-CoA dehydrogenase family protein [Burkholderia pseudomultivorans]|uniref:3-methylmercaptopropionyl-CoA dehydrogenase n=1 Tax=Burkholderia pseudomultivorans TaxID=1207504 RepID=A0ABU2E1T8_9BURK|nr:acyl-CoA dehydrogenase family protein [Burkholderia pseudomultivorans]MDR8727743.1 3-methylmercaptopropionyl-CoA dehydrogenase [Burkholderia pseudomultivorans]MDR8735707.1 3-methylmercaptopropionyl-CoA dehydrogenase [Burkholderia pseudomultivorans]MDR8742755.1 3-methylmercaptopropionyl-CoA dehydrogenase [Burkholderia pseudomultivorans]MDR8753820.1 3-methylmercaptopropionyl-CoA dehydrogenase [Burkholderia pseudomultivorans]MDR8779043.1 3-methylmercaptopropionyl-CoA dehydrogenase [Burkholderi
MTTGYSAPLRDMQFVIDEWLDAPALWRRVPAWADLDASMASQVLDEAARFVSGRIAPLDAHGDLEGCRFDGGDVTTPSGFRDAYRDYVDAGWPTLALDPDCGGQGLPHLFDVALQEMLAAANHAWLMSPGLTHGAVACLREHGSERLRRELLPKIASGEWLTTMCLTEPQAGSDLGLLRTQAVPDPAAGGYRISGSKLFVTGGEHDLTDNIVHLVLARLPDAPPGTRGLSLFVVPKWRDGPAGPVRNGVRCDGIEKKMGLKASPTCAMRFDAALGWLVGEPHRGLASMFVMMNAARLQVAMQGIGHAQRAWQAASAYARERMQGRAAGGAAPIASHPAIRRILCDARAIVEGERAIGYWIAHWLDVAAHDPDASTRQAASGMASLLTPIAKAFFTANGFATASNALQVFGGYGYIHEYGIEQTVRDCRVSMLYEGTNEIQAIDLLVRKVLGDRGDVLRMLLDTLRAEAARCTAAAAPGVTQAGARLAALCADVERATADVMRASAADPELPYRVADDYLAMLGWLLLAFAWARTLRIVGATADDDPFRADKRATGAYFFDYPFAAFAHRRALVDAGCRAPLPAAAA